jgi:putative endonuclease
MAEPKKNLGNRSESLAVEFLRSRGYRILSRNYRCHFGEIDLVALQGRVVVFVEVRSRSGDRFGSPLETVGLKKQKKVSQVALHFLSKNRIHGEDARFDVIGITWERETPRIEHIQNAFELRSIDFPP